MSEITKLYENAGIEVPAVRLKIFKDDNGKIYTQPPFTAEKQLELIKWLGAEDFENALAGLINSLWQDLTEEEKQQVKGILE